MLSVLVSFLISLALANDGVSSGPMGGLVLLKQENVAMKKETLIVSPKKISVEYTFRNQSAQDVETFVQFPLPIEADPMDDRYGNNYDPKFKVIVNGKAVKASQSQKIYNPKNLTEDLVPILKKKKLVKGDSAEWTKTVDEMSYAEKNFLQKSGLLSEGGYPEWVVQKIFYWKQRFPANQEITVHHEYMPHVGASVPRPEVAFRDSCADESVKKRCSEE